MNIHIEHQTAGIVNIAEGDMTFYGQHGTVMADENARRAARELRSALAGAALDRSAARTARVQVTKIDAAVHAPQPDKPRIARPLQQLTRLLAAAGSLIIPGAALIGPLHTLASWLGELGVPILRLLPG